MKLIMTQATAIIHFTMLEQLKFRKFTLLLNSP